MARSVTSQPLALTQVDQAVIFAELLAPYGTTGSLSGTAWDMGLAYLGVYGPDGTYRAEHRHAARSHLHRRREDRRRRSSSFRRSSTALTSQSSRPARALHRQRRRPSRSGIRNTVARPFVAEYGVTVGNLTRTVNSTSFANWVRMDGQNDASGNPLFAVSAGDVMANPQTGTLRDCGKADSRPLTSRLVRRCSSSRTDSLPCCRCSSRPIP